MQRRVSIDGQRRRLADLLIFNPIVFSSKPVEEAVDASVVSRLSLDAR